MYSVENFKVTIDGTDIHAMVTSMSIYESIHGNIKATLIVNDQLNFFDLFFRGVNNNMLQLEYTYFDVPVDIMFLVDGISNQKITKQGKTYHIDCVSVNTYNQQTGRICSAHSGTSSDVLAQIWTNVHTEKNILAIDSVTISTGKYVVPNLTATTAIKNIVNSAYCEKETPMFLYQRLIDSGVTRFTSVDSMINDYFLEDFEIRNAEVTREGLDTPLTTIGTTSSFTLTHWNTAFISKAAGGMWGKEVRSVSLDETTDVVTPAAEVTAIPITKMGLSKNLYSEKCLLSAETSTQSEILKNGKYRLFNVQLKATGVIAIPGIGCGMAIHVSQGEGQTSGTKTDGRYVMADINHVFVMDDGQMNYTQDIGLVRE